MAALRNKYWILRHGRSVPNESGLIVSHLSNGVLPIYGLAPSGILQAKEAGNLFLKVEKRKPTFMYNHVPKSLKTTFCINVKANASVKEELKMAGILADQVCIFASPFKRTTETAQIVADILGLASTKPSIELLEDLRERYFGPPLELQSHEHYPEIWAIDAQNPMVGPEGGESVADVGIRVIKAIMKMESEVQGCGVLVVSHGDTLQILQTVVHAALPTMSSSDDGTLSSHLTDTIFTPVLSTHRNYALLTGQLRRLA